VDECVVKAQSQRLMPIECLNISSIEADTLLFEPKYPYPAGCLIARSIHSKSNSLFCNIMNSTDADVVFPKDQIIGTVVEAEIVDSNFNKDVLTYKPLDIHKLIHSSGKTCSSKPISVIGSTPEITTNDIVRHSIKSSIKTLKIGKQLDKTQQTLMFAVLQKNEKVFQWKANEVGRTQLVEHCIPTGENKPIQQRQYPIPSVAREYINTQVNDMLNEGFIRPSTSPWRSPVLLAKKKKEDGTIGFRFCIDLKKVNAVTIKDSYSLPLIGECVDALSGAQYFSKIDVDRAYWQVGLREEDKCKTAFVVDGNLFEFNVMPFGSMNAPSTFQRLVDRILRGLTWRQCLVYMDDVLIFSKTFEDHLRDIDEVLARFTFAGLKLKPTKCVFAENEVEYLGFKFTDKGLQPTTTKINALLNVTPPDTTKKLFSFLCSVNYYRSLIPNYGRITADLYKMCEGRTRKCSWSASLLRSFAFLKQSLVTAPILAFPNFSLPFFIQTDASNNAIGAVLLQKQSNLFKPVAFASRKLSETEKRYSTTERELLAIIYAYDQFYSHVYGRKIVFYSDHEPLATMTNLKNPMGRLGRLLHRLQDVDYQIVYLPGVENFLPDYLSRAFEEEESESNNIELRSTIDWAEEQSLDLNIQQIIDLIGRNQHDSEWLKVDKGSRWVRERKELFIAGGILKHGDDKIVCPTHMKNEILHHYHDSPFSGHRGFETTLTAIQKRYFWNYMPSEIKAYCQSCEACQTFNYACLHQRAPLKPIRVVRPWQLVGTDFMGPFKISKSGNKYIILAIDHFTKFVEGAATRSFDAPTTAGFLFNNVICRYGMIEHILADQGVNFESQLVKHLCELLGTTKLRTSTYHAAGNGITERVNKNIKPNLAKYVNDSHDDWDLFLQMAISAYNNSFHSSIGMTPFEAQFGRKSILVADVIMNHQLPAATRLKDVADFTFALRESAAYINEVIRENTLIAQDKQQSAYNRFVKDRSIFKVGDIVKINNYRTRVGYSAAFEKKFLGPYRIVKVLGDLNYQLEAPNLAPQIVHYNRMLPYNVRNEFLVEQPSNSTAEVPVAISQRTLTQAHIEDALPIGLIYSPSLKRRRKQREEKRLVEEYTRLSLITNSFENAQIGAPVTLRRSERIANIETRNNVIEMASESDTENNIINSFYISSESSASADSLEIERPVTAKGKVMVPCPRCNIFYEEKTGLRIHGYSCKGIVD
jgi:hypothetical protein